MRKLIDGRAGRRAALALAASGLLAGCGGQFSFGAADAPGADETVAEVRPGATFDATRDDVREDPALFAAQGVTIWDGRPSLGGVWVAHPLTRETRLVRIRNLNTGQSVDGALVRRDPSLPGPSVHLSSDAARATGVNAGEVTQIEIVALADAASGAEVVAEAPPPGGVVTAENGVILTNGETPAGSPSISGDLSVLDAPQQQITPSQTTEVTPEAAAGLAELEIEAPAETTPTAGAAEAVAVAAAEQAPTPKPAAIAAAAATPAPQTAAAATQLDVAAPEASAPVEAAAPGGVFRGDVKYEVVGGAAPSVAAPAPTSEAAPLPAAVTAAVEDPAPAPTPAPTPAPAAAPAAAQPIGEGPYFIQVAVFGVAENAARTADAFTSAGFPVKRARIGGGSLERVLLGPFDQNADAVRALDAVKNRGFKDAIRTKG